MAAVYHAVGKIVYNSPVGGAQRLDQAGDGFSSVQRARSSKSARRVGPGVSGAQHEANARASGGVKKGESARLGRLTGPIDSTERNDGRDSRSTTPNDAWTKANPLPNRAKPDNNPVELSYGASS